MGASVILAALSHYTRVYANHKTSEYADSLARGKNLAFNICGQCHYDEDSKRFIGKEMKDLPGFIGQVYSSNLTHSTTHGILSKYNDEQLAYLLKTGTAHDGRYVPYMVRPNLAHADIRYITLYLRSNDSALLATDKIAGKTDLNIIGKVGTKIAGKPLPYKKGTQAPQEKDSIAYGRYLADNLACFHCHSKNIIGLNYLEPERSDGYMEGGMKFKTPQGKKIYASNLTPDRETGIGNYTRQDLYKALTLGIKPNGDSIQLPMQQFKRLTQKQSDAIYYYLHSLKPVKNKIRNKVTALNK